MPDWLTHTLAGWITGKAIKMEVGLLVAGSLIPDLAYMNLVFLHLGINIHQFLYAFHTPAVAFIVAGIFALFFEDVKKAFIPLGIGIVTHFILDFFLVHVSGGMKLLFPISWSEWQYYLIRSDDYNITIVAILVAILVYLLLYGKKIRSKHCTKGSSNNQIPFC